MKKFECVIGGRLDGILHAPFGCAPFGCEDGDIIAEESDVYAFLNAMGDKGWELTAVAYEKHYYFKREKEDER